MTVKAKASVDNLPKYIPAKSLKAFSEEYKIAEKDIIKLAGNENRFGCSSKVMEAILEKQSEFPYYPDANITLLREKLSRKHKIDSENLIFGNGSFELLTLIGEAYINKGDEVIYSDPSFGWYLNVTLKNEGTIVKIPVNENMEVDTERIIANITDKTKVIWLCNPNNPTGTKIDSHVLESFVEKVPDSVLIVLDEAYIDFVEEDYIDTVEFVRKYDNIIILRTFSKAYGLASFRVGYGMAALSIVENLLKVKLPINLGLTPQIAALAALDDEEFADYVIKTNREHLQYYYEEFEKLHLRYIPSNGNFILVHIGISGAYAEQEFAKRGIIIRNGEEFGLNKWLRISIGKPEENAKVIMVLKQILREG